MPIAALVDSGGKSIHAIVRVDAETLEQYKERVQLIRQVLPDCFDGSTIDAVRFSRLPNCKRGNNRQRLLATNVGAASWREWENTLEIDDGMPQPEEWTDYKAREIEEPTVIIEGVAHARENLMLGGAAKTYKS